ncbi:myotubularin-related protein 9-like [Clavelina lepadiformis]|uniref:myotubularin-related protein 9-like n=1 Tax=Clavelina lepadiformis TaxID=159417 RepID=UPI0040434B88
MEFSEHILTPKIEETRLEGPDISPVFGTTCLTGHHLIFYSHNKENKEYWILHRNVDSVEKRYSLDKNVLVLKCKDFKHYFLSIVKQEEANNVCNSIEILSNQTKSSYQYPFFFRPKFSIPEDGYDLFSVEKEFQSVSSKSDQWRLSNINITFDVCTSYPSQIIVPASITDQEIRKSAKFRHGGRFPVISYLHQNGRAIMRCGQPLTGNNNKRCKEDERLVNCVLGSNHRGYILDTRTLQSAQQARAKGGGFESEYNYPQWRKVHNSLQKCAVQQESFVRIVEACLDQSSSSEKWQSKLESSSWLSHVRDVLAAACLAAQCIDREGASLLVHGSDGMDSTLQVTSLAQVILDPDCRTIRGFLSLIDKEWIQAGHPFMDRCFHSVFSNQRIRSEGPSFTIFLDCVFQLLMQFPCSFEFSVQLLCELQNHAYASQFGTFLFNNEMERRNHKLRTKTISLWSYLLSEEALPTLINPVYQSKEGVIWPSVAPQSMHFWDALFLPKLDTSTTIRAFVNETLSEIGQLQNELLDLKQEVGNLEKLAADADGVNDVEE